MDLAVACQCYWDTLPSDVPPAELHGSTGPWFPLFPAYPDASRGDYDEAFTNSNWWPTICYA